MPIFNADVLAEQLNEVCQMFVLEFLQVKDGAEGQEPRRVYLPYTCLAMKRERNMEPRALLELCWKFVPVDRTPPSLRTQIRFLKYRGDPRRRSDMRKLVFSSPALNVDPATFVDTLFEPSPGCLICRQRAEPTLGKVEET